MALDSTKKAVVLLSGGLDSSTTLAVALKEGYECHALTINYQQRHHAEIEAAKRVASQLRVFDHKVIDLDLRAFGGSALTSEEAVPKNRSQASMACEIPVTYVPARNTVFLSIALAWAESLNAFDIFLGVNAVDYSGYPDCRPDFIRSFERISAPAAQMLHNLKLRGLVFDSGLPMHDAARTIATGPGGYRRCSKYDGSSRRRKLSECTKRKYYKTSKVGRCCFTTQRHLC